MSGGSQAQALRLRAEELRAQLRRLERHDWPRWLRDADGVTREVSELLRRAAELEVGRPAG